MSLEEKKALVRRMVEASNNKDPAVIDALLDELMAPEFVDHHGQIRGRENVKKAYTMMLKAYPDIHRTIEDIIAEGDKVWWLEKVTGTDSSGKKMDATALTIVRIVNGQAVELQAFAHIFIKRIKPHARGERDGFSFSRVVISHGKAIYIKNIMDLPCFQFIVDPIDNGQLRPVFFLFFCKRMPKNFCGMHLTIHRAMVY